MSEESKNTSAPDLGNSLAFLVLRGWLGVRAIVTGIEKYGGTRTESVPVLDPTTGQPDPSGVMRDMVMKFYSGTNYHAIPDSLKTKFAGEPMLPGFLTAPFYAVLGPLLILLGITTLIGLGTRISLFAQGIVYIALTVGLILINQNDGVAWLAIHVIMVALALMTAKHNRFCVCKKW